MDQDLLTNLQPALSGLATAVVSLLAAVLTYYAGRIGQKKIVEMDKTLETQHRVVMKEAMTTAANAMVAKSPVIVESQPESAVEEVVGYVLKSVPQAIKVLNPPAGVLADLALSAIQGAINSNRKEK